MSWKHRVLALVSAGFTVIATLGMSVGSASADDGARRIKMTDDCDSTTFNAVLGAGSCIGGGRTTFNAFIAELTATKTAKKWVFNPTRAGAPAGQGLTAVNAGGEAHTFTCVTQFGGGVVPLLNQLTGNVTPAVLCAGESFDASLVLPGASRSVTVGSGPTAMYECLIHPWMRTTLHVENDAD